MSLQLWLELKKERVNQKNETKTYVLQIKDTMNIHNTGFKDLLHPGRGKKGSEDFLDCIELHLNTSQTCTDILEKLAIAIDVFRIHL